MKRYLLDTHIILWIAENPSSFFPNDTTNALKDAQAMKFVSIVSAWEVAIKLATKKLRLDGGLTEFYRIVDANKFTMLPIRKEYLDIIVDLPQAHKDPFDRLLVATAIEEDMTIITADENIHKYNVNWIWHNPINQQEMPK